MTDETTMNPNVANGSETIAIAPPEQLYELDLDAALANMTWEEFRAMWFSHGEIPGGGKWKMSYVQVNQGCYDLMSETVRRYFKPAGPAP